ncbi:hypothetical protein RJ639_010631 [Escallonia herrerae]|uniref:Senescence regulator n=1 Tax=Escallonia herrerae TaxID=1293975 RepID=A0AA89APP7_9ASTE|nr:hypothetical protein RJ639_010631 [Escallonia herrerae]
MDATGAATRFRHRQTPSSDRFLGILPPGLSPAAANSSSADELNEDDLFWSGDSTSSSPSPNATTTAARSFPHSDNFGILAALPESDAGSVFNHKASIFSSASTSPSSSSRTSFRAIPTVPKKPPLDRQNFHMSAPVNVPVLSEAVRRSRAAREFDDIDGTDGDWEAEGDAEVLPPHELVAASRQSPVLACSVMEGVGRTLKGGDLRQVRNAVWRRTGFLD